MVAEGVASRVSLGVGGGFTAFFDGSPSASLDKPQLRMPHACRSETTSADHERQLPQAFAEDSGRIQDPASPRRAGTPRAVGLIVTKTKRAKQTATTSSNLPVVKKPGSVRPMSSRPPVSARVDVVVADLARDPRRK